MLSRGSRGRCFFTVLVGVEEDRAVGGAELGREEEARVVLLGTAGMVTTFRGTAMGDCEGSLRPGVEEGAEGV